MQKSLVVQSLAKGKHIGFLFALLSACYLLSHRNTIKSHYTRKYIFRRFRDQMYFGFLICIIFLPVTTDYLEKGNFYAYAVSKNYIPFISFFHFPLSSSTSSPFIYFSCFYSLISTLFFFQEVCIAEEKRFFFIPFFFYFSLFFFCFFQRSN